MLTDPRESLESRALQCGEVRLSKLNDPGPLADTGFFFSEPRILF
jgi:hypothetical protein